jgi:hypothetical protein
MMKELELPGQNLRGVTTDGAPSMIGKKIGLMGRIRQELDKRNTKFYMELHSIIYQQSLCGKTLKFEHVKVVNFI